MSSALNLGIREMKGDYFSWLSHDDFYLENKIESEIEALKKIDEKKTVVYCDSTIDKDGKPLPKLRKKKELKKNKSNDLGKRFSAQSSQTRNFKRLRISFAETNI